MRKLATIRTISDIRPIQGADRIEVAQVDGWECVVKKGEFHIGEKIVYVEVDSIMPEKPEFEFLRDRKFRVRTIKLRKQVSQGLVLPLTILPTGTSVNEGDDVTETLGIKKYDPQAEQERMLLACADDNRIKQHGKLFQFMMRFRWFRRAFGTKPKKKGFPAWIVKTDKSGLMTLKLISRSILLITTPSLFCSLSSTDFPFAYSTRSAIVSGNVFASSSRGTVLIPRGFSSSAISCVLHLWSGKIRLKA